MGLQSEITLPGSPSVPVPSERDGLGASIRPTSERG